MTLRERYDVTDESTTLASTREVLAGVLAELLGGSPERYAPDTELFGSLPELDSLALVELITVIEDRFGFELDEDDITAEVFGTVQSLAAHVDVRSG